jgi:hypothetical protein
MRPWWNFSRQRYGMPIREVETHEDNVYIIDQRGHVWQIWFETTGPHFQLVGDEAQEAIDTGS